MSQSLANQVQRQVGAAIVEALKTAHDFFWLRSQTFANPHTVCLR